MTLHVENLSVSYSGTAILSDITFALTPGHVTGLIGPNGTGKSTLLKAMAGLIPAQMNMRVNNTSLENRQHKRQAIAYMPQDTSTNSVLTVLEVVLLGRLDHLGLRLSKVMQQSALAALDQFGLADLQYRSLAALSGGQRQMVYLAQALFRDPQILLLDEPTAALDLRHQLIVLEAIQRHAKDKNMIIIAAMHDLTLASRFSNHLLCLNNGSLMASDSPQKVLTEERLQSVYQVMAEVHPAPSGTLSITPLRAL